MWPRTTARAGPFVNFLWILRCCEKYTPDTQSTLSTRIWNRISQPQAGSTQGSRCKIFILHFKMAEQFSL